MAEALRTVAFVDDDDDLRAANVQSLEAAGFEVLPFRSAAKALAAIDAGFRGVVVTDVRMPQMDGRQLFERLHVIDPDIPVILITGHADVSQAVEALHAGAYDFVAKPYDNDRLIQSVINALERRQHVLENRSLRAVAEEAQRAWPLIGESPAMETLRARLREAADADVDTLIVGETGVGKELAARALHYWGRRREHPFVVVNCGALPAGMVESELFGHELGAFPGAMRKRIGRLEHAHRGTLFLDEIEAMPPEAQTKLLRFLAEREIAPLGTNEVRTVDVRVVAATKVDLAVDGQIRPELYHRLNVANIRVPPLRERRADIPTLFAHFTARAADRFNREPPPLTNAVRRTLLEHDWPGNVRELSHFAERSLLALNPQTEGLEAKPTPGGLKGRVEKYEAEVICEALAAHSGDIQQAIITLSMPRKTLYQKIRRHGIDLSRYRTKA